MVGARRSLAVVSVTIHVEDDLLVVGSHQIAVVRCAKERLDVDRLRAAVETLPPQATHVCLLRPDTAAEAIRALAACGAPCATARPVTDALKEVAKGRVVASVERSNLYRAGLPVLIEVAALRDRVKSLAAGGIPAGALLGDESGLRFIGEEP